MRTHESMYSGQLELFKINTRLRLDAPKRTKCEELLRCIELVYADIEARRSQNLIGTDAQEKALVNILAGYQFRTNSNYDNRHLNLGSKEDFDTLYAYAEGRAWDDEDGIWFSLAFTLLITAGMTLYVLAVSPVVAPLGLGICLGMASAALLGGLGIAYHLFPHGMTTDIQDLEAAASDARCVLEP